MPSTGPSPPSGTSRHANRASTSVPIWSPALSVANASPASSSASTTVRSETSPTPTITPSTVTNAGTNTVTTAPATAPRSVHVQPHAQQQHQQQQLIQPNPSQLYTPQPPSSSASFLQTIIHPQFSQYTGFTPSIAQHRQLYPPRTPNTATGSTPPDEFAQPNRGNAIDNIANNIGITASHTRSSIGSMYPPLITNASSSSSSSRHNTSVRPQFRSKIVCEISCRHCNVVVCKRGMKAILLADTNVELYSTDSPPFGVQLVLEDYVTRNCQCRIRDVACLGCGNVLGYHVTQPCETCLDACNNGHFWMFHINEIYSNERVDEIRKQTLLWAHLPRADLDRGRGGIIVRVCR